LIFQYFLYLSNLRDSSLSNHITNLLINTQNTGGEALVSEQAGGDGTEAFEHAHPESIMKLTMGSKALKEAFRGMLDGKAPSRHKSQNGSFSNRQKELETSLVLNDDKVPPIDAVLNLHDFASIAQNKMVATGRKQAWDYYSSGADDELTYNENVNAFQRIWLRPRILVNVKDVDMSSKILGIKTSMPLYLSAVAMCGMGHEDGEVAWTKAAGEQDIVFMVPNLSSKDIKTITDARVKRMFFLCSTRFVSLSLSLSHTHTHKHHTLSQTQVLSP
jgi:L-lactate dehydrogenase (cytochrome)